MLLPTPARAPGTGEARRRRARCSRACTRHTERRRHLPGRQRRRPGEAARAPLQRRQGGDGLEDAAAHGPVLERGGRLRQGRRTSEHLEVGGGPKGSPVPAQPGRGGAEMVPSGVQGEAPEPAVQGLHVPEVAEAPERPPEDLLEDILRLVPVADDGHEEQQQATAPRGDERVEGLRIPVCREPRARPLPPVRRRSPTAHQTDPNASPIRGVGKPLRARPPRRRWGRAPLCRGNPPGRCRGRSGGDGPPPPQTPPRPYGRPVEPARRVPALPAAAGVAQDALARPSVRGQTPGAGGACSRRRSRAPWPPPR